MVMTNIKTEIGTRGQNKDIYTFRLSFNDQDYDVSLYVNRGPKPWLLVFNKIGSNVLPLSLKLAPGYRVATYYDNYSEFQTIKAFFGYTSKGQGIASKPLFEKINKGLKFVNQLPISERKIVMSQHDQSIHADEKDKIYFGGFIHLGLSKNGEQKHRSAFNTWKVQHILPIEVWEQIRIDDTISVQFVTLANAGYSLEIEEISKIKAMISEQL